MSISDSQALVQRYYEHPENTALVVIKFIDMADSSYDFVVVLEPYMEELDFSDALKMLRHRNIHRLSLFKGWLSLTLSADRPFLQRRTFLSFLQQSAEGQKGKTKLTITARAKSLVAGLSTRLHDLFVPRIGEHASQNMPVIRLSNSTLRSRFQARTTTAVAIVIFIKPSFKFPTLLFPDFNMVGFRHGLQRLSGSGIERVHLYNGSISHALPGRNSVFLPRADFASLLQGQPDGRLIIAARDATTLTMKVSKQINQLISIGFRGPIFWLILPPFEAFFATLALALSRR